MTATLLNGKRLLLHVGRSELFIGSEHTCTGKSPSRTWMILSYIIQNAKKGKKGLFSFEFQSFSEILQTNQQHFTLKIFQMKFIV